MPIVHATRQNPWPVFPLGTGLVLLLTAGCGDRGAGAPGDVPAGTPLTLEAEPRLSVGVASGDTIQELFRVVTPFLLPDGGLVVPLAGSRTIRVFDQEGGFLTSLGRPGEGPGEFRSLGSAWARGDTIEAWDGTARRITRFLPDGTFETVQLIDPPRSSDSAVPGVLGDGWAVSGVERAGSGMRDELAVHRIGRDGSRLGELGRVEGIARFDAEGFGGPEPLSPRGLLRLVGEELYLVDTLVPTVRVLGPAGDIVRQIEWRPDPAPPPPDEAFRGVVDTAVARAAADDPWTARTRLEAAPVPERLSVLWDVIVDEEGFLWIRPYEPILHASALGGLGTGGAYTFPGSGQGGRWVLLSPEGEEVGTIEVPERLNPVQITADAVVGIHRDELGVESVRVYSLERAR